MNNEKNIIHASKAAEPVGLYPHARRVGNLLFLSGVGPREKGNPKIPGATYNEEGKIIDYDMATHVHSVFRNVLEVLEASGAKWEDLVDVTVFLINMERDFKVYNQIWAEYFKDVQACRTTLEINCLPTPIAIELKCIAVLPNE